MDRIFDEPRRTRPSYILLILFFGIVLGTFSKFIEAVSISASNPLSYVVSFLGDVFTEVGIWVFLGALIVYISETMLEACISVVLFFLGMVTAYYIYSSVLFGFFPKDEFIFWGIASLFVVVPAAILALPQKLRGLQPIIEGLPIGFLIYLGYDFYYTFKPVSLVHLLLAVGLLIHSMRAAEPYERIILLISSVISFVGFYFLAGYVVDIIIGVIA